MSVNEWDQKEFNRLFAEAIRLTHANEWVAARDLYRQLLQSNPQGYLNHGKTLLNLGELEHYTGNTEAGIRRMEESIRVFPGCIISYRWLSKILWETKRLYRLPLLKFWYLRNFRAIYEEQMRLQSLPR